MYTCHETRMLGTIGQDYFRCVSASQARSWVAMNMTANKRRRHTRRHGRDASLVDFDELNIKLENAPRGKCYAIFAHCEMD